MWSLACFVAYLHAAAVAPPAAPAVIPEMTPAQAAVYNQLIDQYMQSKWDELETALAAQAKTLSGYPPPQQSDLDYLRQTFAECRPAWWATCKADKKGALRVTAWDRTLNLAYDPSIKGNLEMQSTGNNVKITVAFKDMDDPAPAEHGFSKGELSSLGTWMTIGKAQFLLNTAALYTAEKAGLTLCLDLQGDLTGLYYGMPRARRWGLYLFSIVYLEKYAKLPVAGSRRCAAQMLVTEVLRNPAQYPSIKLPPLPAEKYEENLALELAKWIEKHAWTFAEDRALRAALKNFVASNQKAGMATRRTLPNGLLFDMNADADRRCNPSAKRG